MGRTTKIPAIRDGLRKIARSYYSLKTGDVLRIYEPGQRESRSSIHFADGDVLLPPSLTSPRTTPWRSIYAAFGVGNGEGDLPEQEKINKYMRNFLAEQKYIPTKVFSCMEHTLDMYLQGATLKETKE